MTPSPFITLITDFGVRDAYVGSMKGVIAGSAPHASVIDVCHAVPPQDIQKGAFVLWSGLDAFPKQSIHVVVVDPGVGSARRALAVETDSAFFVGPDNGVLWPSIAQHSSWKAVVLDRPAFFREPVSSTFHGRDIFSPVAAHLARGVPLEQLGSPVLDIVQLDLFEVEHTGNTLIGQVIDVDHFGNLITNISASRIQDVKAHLVTPEGSSLALSTTFSDVEPGECVAYIDSFGLLEVAIRDGSAQRSLGWERGQRIEVQLS